MAKRKNGADPARNENHTDTPPPDRPDQISVSADELPEEITIFDAPGVNEERDAQVDSVDLADRAPPVESREKRTREENDGSVIGRRDRDDEKYSKAVQRRINREIALRKRSEARLNEERAARLELEQRLQKLERAQLEEQSQASLREIDAKIQAAAARLAKAKEENDTAAEVAAQVELNDLQNQKVLLQQRQQSARLVPEREDSTANDATNARAPVDTGRSAEWIRAQRRWWNTSRWRDAKQDAIHHDETILAEINDGELDFEPYSDEHFEELARRLKADYPDLEVRTLDGEIFEDYADDDIDEDVRRERREHMSRNDEHDRRAAASRRAPMGGLGGRDGRRERNAVELARRGKVELTPDDFAVMRIFKLDPNDPMHKKAFAQQRARTLLTEANRGARR